MPGVASSATAVLVGHIAGATSRIRIGSGGIMLPNHAPLVVAEAFGTLAELYRTVSTSGSVARQAPTADACAMLRRDRIETEEDFPADVAELQRRWRWPSQASVWSRMPGAGTMVPIWLLGSSLYSAHWRPSAACPTPSPRISHRACCCRRSTCTGTISGPRPFA